MANHQIPRTANRIEQIFGIDADGNIVVCAVYQHTRAGHTHPMFYIIQYRELDRRIDRSSRGTREFSGPEARAHAEAAMTEVRDLLDESREQAAGRLARLRQRDQLIRARNEAAMSVPRDYTI